MSWPCFFRLCTAAMAGWVIGHSSRTSDRCCAAVEVSQAVNSSEAPPKTTKTANNNVAFHAQATQPTWNA